MAKTVAAVVHRRLERRALREYVACLEFKRGRVDAENGVIYDVKILGLVSENGRRYLPEALQRALSFYEGLSVHINHPKSPTENRDIRGKTAWLEAVRYVDNDGLRGDLHFVLPLDDFQKKVLWAAEHKPDQYGLSQNADGKGETNRDGKFVVSEILEVRSVDLVDKPATTRSLFESKTMEKTTLKKVLESGNGPAKLRLTLLEGLAGVAILEDEYADGGEESPRQCVAKAVAALVNSQEPGDHEMATKLMKILKPEEPEVEEEEEEPPMDDAAKKKKEEEDAAKTEADKKKAEESRKHRRAPGTVPLTEAKIQSLVKLSGLEAKAELLESLRVLTSEDAAVKLLTAIKAMTPSNGKQTTGPRSQGPGRTNLSESRTALPKTLDEAVARWKRK